MLPVRASMNENFRKVIEEYEAITNKPLNIFREERGYVQLKADSWFKGLHYEFLDMSNYLTVEFHIEVKTVSRFVDVLRSWVYVGGTEGSTINPLLQDILDTDEIDVSTPWIGKDDFSRLIAIYPYDDPKRVAEAMARFIHATQHKIDAWLKTK